VALHVPATVQVEAGWDRTSPGAVQINRYPITINPLDSPSADAAARIVSEYSVSPADAHVGVLCQKLAAQDVRVIVLTSDPDDIELVASPATITALRI
jgi:predicted nucleic acid-binding protein